MLSLMNLCARVLRGRWKPNKNIDLLSNNEFNENANFRTRALRRLVDLTFTLASSNDSFRGHRQVIGVTNNGNFPTIAENFWVHTIQFWQNLLTKTKHKSPKRTYHIIVVLDKMSDEFCRNIKLSRFCRSSLRYHSKYYSTRTTTV